MTIEAIVCLLLLIIIVQSTIEGYKNGIIGIMLPIISFVLALMCAQTGNAIYGDAVNEMITEPASESIATLFAEIDKNYEIPDNPENSKNTVNQITYTTSYIIGEILSADNSSINHYLKNTLVFVIAFLLVYFLLKVITSPLTHFMTLGTVNHIVGAVSGCVLSVIKIWVLMDILIVLGVYIPSFRELNAYLMKSNFYQLISSYNLSAKLLGLY